MKFSRLRLSAALTPVAFIAPAIIVIGLLAGGESSAATTPRPAGATSTAAGSAAAGSAAAAHSAAGHPAAAPPMIIDCRQHGLVRPHGFILACADAGSGLTRMHWPTWRSSAYGTGMNFENDCVPNCAEGKFFYFPALVVLWRPQPLPHHPATRYFTRMTRILTGRHCMPDSGGTRTCLPVTSTLDLSSAGGL